MDKIEEKRRRAKLTRRKIIRYIKKQIKGGKTRICLNQFRGVITEKISRDRLQEDILKAGILFDGWGYLTTSGWYITIRKGK